MELELLDGLDVPGGHVFLREATLAWWFVPSRYEGDFARVIRALWVTAVTPRMASLVLDYFRLVVPPRDFPPFLGHMTTLLDSLMPTGASLRPCKP
jgi:hypothetical protein